jgi:hypothetical protein
MGLKRFTAEELWDDNLLRPVHHEAALEIFLQREAGLEDARWEARASVERSIREQKKAEVLPIDIDALVERDAKEICATRLRARNMDVNQIPEADMRAAEKGINERIALKLACGAEVWLYCPEEKAVERPAAAAIGGKRDDQQRASGSLVQAAYN